MWSFTLKAGSSGKADVAGMEVRCGCSTTNGTGEVTVLAVHLNRCLWRQGSYRTSRLWIAQGFYAETEFS